MENKEKLQLTYDMIKIFKDKYDDFPFIKESKTITEQQNILWCTIDAALKNGRRSLPGGSSLTKLIIENFPGSKPRTRRGKYKITVEMLEKYIFEFFEQNQHYPNSVTQELISNEIFGKSWKDIDVCLRNGKIIGLEEKSSLIKFTNDHFGDVNKASVGTLYVKNVVKYLTNFYNKYDYYPSAIENKEVTGGPTYLTWNKIHKALYHGYYGLPGGSSLAEVKEKYLGQINKNNLPPWTEEEVALAMYKFFCLYGYYPGSRERFAVPGYPDDSWIRLNLALQQGKRGFGKENKGNSLALVAEKYFRRRNQANLSKLDEQELLSNILEFYKENCYYPNNKTKLSVPNMPNENWATLSYALRYKTRGLENVKENSLIELAKKHFGYVPYSNYYNENLCRKIIEKLTGHKFLSSDEFKIDWLIGQNGYKLQIDGINLELGVAFEHQGVQHCLFNSKFHNNNEQDFFKQLQKDAYKLKLCQDNNIKLICIYYDEKDKEKFIREKLLELNIPII